MIRSLLTAVSNSSGGSRREDAQITQMSGHKTSEPSYVGTCLNAYSNSFMAGFFAGK